MSIKKIAAMACALAMTTTVFASCGNTDDSSSSAADTKKTTTTTTTAPESSEPVEDSEPEKEYPEQLTEFKGHDAMLMFADKDWLWQNMNLANDANKTGESYGVDADITGDGEYTVSINKKTIVGKDDAPNQYVAVDENTGEAIGAECATVFVVDILGICDGTIDYKGESLKKNKLNDGEDFLTNKETKGKYTGQEITCEVTSIKADGEEVEFDPSKIVYGNIEDNNNCYRIEIYNAYGDTAKDSPIDQNALAFEEELSVTFKISGLTKEAAAE